MSVIHLKFPAKWPGKRPTFPYASPLGKTAVVTGEVHRCALARSDLHVTLDGVAIKPALALAEWIAFAPMHGQAMVMGDLVLPETETNPVGGHGDPVKMANVIRSALSSAGKTLFDPLAPNPNPPPAIDLDMAKLDAVMRIKGTANGGVDQFGVPRRDPVMEGGIKINGAPDDANGIGFQPTGDGNAAITGDFLATGGEVNPLIRELRAGDIEVTAIQSHMPGEQSRLFFIRFWANDDAMKLARSVRAALDKTAVASTE